MEEMKRKREKVYISGRMSGLSAEEVSRRFTEADERLRRQGCRTVNPARVWVCRWRWLYRLLERVAGRERAYDLVLLYDLWLLSRCHRIYMVGGDWPNSRGALTERDFAKRKGIKVDEKVTVIFDFDQMGKTIDDFFHKQNEQTEKEQ